ncbi:hypothetical protein BASA81_010487 [Batrachochytrium salamandrivorans]|nr:hypothetical protein BASA81_010487 [Batrachochytrium salamandrivorans]
MESITGPTSATEPHSGTDATTIVKVDDVVDSWVATGTGTVVVADGSASTIALRTILESAIPNPLKTELASLRLALDTCRRDKAALTEKVQAGDFERSLLSMALDATREDARTFQRLLLQLRYDPFSTLAVNAALQRKIGDMRLSIDSLTLESIHLKETIFEISKVRSATALESSQKSLQIDRISAENGLLVESVLAAQAALSDSARRIAELETENSAQRRTIAALEKSQPLPASRGAFSGQGDTPIQDMHSNSCEFCGFSSEEAFAEQLDANVRVASLSSQVDQLRQSSHQLNTTYTATLDQLVSERDHSTEVENDLSKLKIQYAILEESKNTSLKKMEAYMSLNEEHHNRITTQYSFLRDLTHTRLKESASSREHLYSQIEEFSALFKDILGIIWMLGTSLDEERQCRLRVERAKQEFSLENAILLKELQTRARLHDSRWSLFQKQAVELQKMSKSTIHGQSVDELAAKFSAASTILEKLIHTSQYEMVEASATSHLAGEARMLFLESRLAETETALADILMNDKRHREWYISLNSELPSLETRMRSLHDSLQTYIQCHTDKKTTEALEKEVEIGHAAVTDLYEAQISRAIQPNRAVLAHSFPVNAAPAILSMYGRLWQTLGLGRSHPYLATAPVSEELVNHTSSVDTSRHLSIRNVFEQAASLISSDHPATNSTVITSDTSHSAADMVLRSLFQKDELICHLQRRIAELERENPVLSIKSTSIQDIAVVSDIPYNDSSCDKWTKTDHDQATTPSDLNLQDHVPYSKTTSLVDSGHKLFECKEQLEESTSQVAHLKSTMPNLEENLEEKSAIRLIPKNSVFVQTDGGNVHDGQVQTDDNLVWVSRDKWLQLEQERLFSDQRELDMKARIEKLISEHRSEIDILATEKHSVNNHLSDNIKTIGLMTTVLSEKTDLVLNLEATAKDLRCQVGVLEKNDESLRGQIVCLEGELATSAVEIDSCLLQIDDLKSQHRKKLEDLSCLLSPLAKAADLDMSDEVALGAWILVAVSAMQRVKPDYTDRFSQTCEYDNTENTVLMVDSGQQTPSSPTVPHSIDARREQTSVYVQCSLTDSVACESGNTGTKIYSIVLDLKSEAIELVAQLSKLRQIYQLLDAQMASFQKQSVESTSNSLPTKTNEVSPEYVTSDLYQQAIHSLSTKDQENTRLQETLSSQREQHLSELAKLTDELQGATEYSRALLINLKFSNHCLADTKERLLAENGSLRNEIARLHTENVDLARTSPTPSAAHCPCSILHNDERPSTRVINIPSGEFNINQSHQRFKQMVLRDKQGVSAWLDTIGISHRTAASEQKMTLMARKIHEYCEILIGLIDLVTALQTRRDCGSDMMIQWLFTFPVFQTMSHMVDITANAIKPDSIPAESSTNITFAQLLFGIARDARILEPQAACSLSLAHVSSSSPLSTDQRLEMEPPIQEDSVSAHEQALEIIKAEHLEEKKKMADYCSSLLTEQSRLQAVVKHLTKKQLISRSEIQERDHQIALQQLHRMPLNSTEVYMQTDFFADSKATPEYIDASTTTIPPESVTVVIQTDLAESLTTSKLLEKTVPHAAFVKLQRKCGEQIKTIRKQQSDYEKLKVASQVANDSVSKSENASTTTTDHQIALQQSHRMSLNSTEVYVQTDFFADSKSTLKYSDASTTTMDYQIALQQSHRMPLNSTEVYVQTDFFADSKSTLKYIDASTTTMDHQIALQQSHRMPLNSTEVYVQTDFFADSKSTLKYIDASTTTMDHQTEMQQLHRMPLNSTEVYVQTDFFADSKSTLKYIDASTTTMDHQIALQQSHRMSLSSTEVYVQTDLFADSKATPEYIDASTTTIPPESVTVVIQTDLAESLTTSKLLEKTVPHAAFVKLQRKCGEQIKTIRKQQSDYEKLKMASQMANDSVSKSENASTTTTDHQIALQQSHRMPLDSTEVYVQTDLFADSKATPEYIDASTTTIPPESVTVGIQTDLAESLTTSKLLEKTVPHAAFVKLQRKCGEQIKTIRKQQSDYEKLKMASQMANDSVSKSENVSTAKEDTDNVAKCRDCSQMLQKLASLQEQIVATVSERDTIQHNLTQMEHLRISDEASRQAELDLKASELARMETHYSKSVAEYQASALSRAAQIKQQKVVIQTYSKKFVQAESRMQELELQASHSASLALKQDKALIVSEREKLEAVELCKPLNMQICDLREKNSELSSLVAELQTASRVSISHVSTQTSRVSEKDVSESPPVILDQDTDENAKVINEYQKRIAFLETQLSSLKRLYRTTKLKQQQQHQSRESIMTQQMNLATLTHDTETALLKESLVIANRSQVLLESKISTLSRFSTNGIEHLRTYVRTFRSDMVDSIKDMRKMLDYLRNVVSHYKVVCESHSIKVDKVDSPTTSLSYREQGTDPIYSVVSRFQYDNIRTLISHIQSALAMSVDPIKKHQDMLRPHFVVDLLSHICESLHTMMITVHSPDNMNLSCSFDLKTWLVARLSTESMYFADNAVHRNSTVRLNQSDMTDSGYTLPNVHHPLASIDTLKHSHDSSNAGQGSSPNLVPTHTANLPKSSSSHSLSAMSHPLTLSKPLMMDRGVTLSQPSFIPSGDSIDINVITQPPEDEEIARRALEFDLELAQMKQHSQLASAQTAQTLSERYHRGASSPSLFPRLGQTLIEQTNETSKTANLVNSDSTYLRSTTQHSMASRPFQPRRTSRHSHISPHLGLQATNTRNGHHRQKSIPMHTGSPKSADLGRKSGFVMSDTQNYQRENTGRISILIQPSQATATEAIGFSEQSLTEYSSSRRLFLGTTDKGLDYPMSVLLGSMGDTMFQQADSSTAPPQLQVDQPSLAPINTATLLLHAGMATTSQIDGDVDSDIQSLLDHDLAHMRDLTRRSIASTANTIRSATKLDSNMEDLHMDYTDSSKRPDVAATVAMSYDDIMCDDVMDSGHVPLLDIEMMKALTQESVEQTAQLLRQFERSPPR